ncbi:MAG: HIT domain-containing protein [Acidimicrobiia bacterium]
MARRDWYCEDVLSGKIEVRPTYEDENVLAFHHPYPVSEIHVVVIPKRHVPSLLDEKALDAGLLVSMLTAIQRTVADLSIAERGFYVRANAAAPGVTPHMHWHTLGPGAGANRPEAQT